MGRAPSEAVQKAFVAPTAEIIRRVEVYESDGETPWRPDLWATMLTGGQVTADLGEEERRSVDIELNNDTGELSPRPDGLWWDKVLKVFYGIRLHGQERPPSVAIVEEFEAVGQGLAIKTALAQAGVKTVFYDPLIVNYSELEPFDVIVSVSSSYPRKAALLTEAFQRGKSIITMAPQATSVQLPLLVGASGAVITATDTRRAGQSDSTDSVMVGWDGAWEMAPHAYTKIQTVPATAKVLAYGDDSVGGSSPLVMMTTGIDGQGWIHLQQKAADTTSITANYGDFVNFLGAAMRRLDYYVQEDMWETQIGEFLPDGIDDADDFGDRIKFTGRDYVKRCMADQFSKATMFTKDQYVEDVIKAIAANANIRKFALQPTGRTLGKDTTFERGTERWKAMYDIATAANCDLYFDAHGFLVLAPQNDPLLSPPNLSLVTGPGGNLVKRGKKTSDSQIFNHIVVTGESSDTTVPLVFAEVENADPGSPTNVNRIGRRTKPYSSPLVTSTAQALELANTMLSVAALEEFELDFSSVLHPWVEPGEILEMEEENDDRQWGPRRYLINSLTFPLDLGPMSGTGKRITKVV
ncbi:minor tail protein [Rhodococcus phage Reynauld]|uniref:Minor tail protein n=1 Tax=Rhodococcus phage Reynauld TaxID=3062845 RepID=A0ACD4UH63_9CAUD|nr:minor tail protein [Rhodococcus phage Reynauld]